MTALTPHITVFLRERLPLERGASVHTCETYAYGFKLLFEFASVRLGTAPSRLQPEDLDAKLVMAFLDHVQSYLGKCGRDPKRSARGDSLVHEFVEHRVPSAVDQVHQVLSIPMKRTDTKLVAPLTRPEMQAILERA